MSRTFLMGASAVALTLSSASFADNIVGGGTLLVAKEVGNNALSVVTTASTEFGMFGGFVYQSSNSDAARNAVLQNDETCNVAKVGFTAPGVTCESTKSPNALPGVFFGNSDTILSSAEIAFASDRSSPAVNTVYRNLIQLPFLGTGVAIPVYAPSSVSMNGQVTLMDSDLCGIFSGSITNWSQTSAAALLGNNPITVTFYAFGSGVTFLLTNHLASADGTVCKSDNTAAGVTFAPTQNFATQFPTVQGGIFTQKAVVGGVSYYLPANFVSETDSTSIQKYLLSHPYGIGYVSPDYTAITSVGKQTLFVASISRNVGAPAYYTPTTTNISAALNSVVPPSTNPSNINNKPPGAKTADDPTKWVPITQDTKKGYPIVGYTNIVLTQCDSPASIGTSLSNFLSLHYTNAAYLSIQNTNGFVSLPNTSAGKLFVSAIQTYITSPTVKTGIQSMVCMGVAGRSATSK